MTSRIVVVRVVQQVAGAAVGLLAGLFTASWLGPEGKGLLTVILLVSGVVSQVATLGLHDAASFLRRRRELPAAMLRTAFDRCLVIVGVPAAVGAALTGLLLGDVLWSQALSAPLAVVTGLLVLSRLAALLYKGLLQAEERFATIAGLDFCDAALPGLLWCTGALLSRPSVGLAVASYLTSAMLVAFLSRRRVAVAESTNAPANVSIRRELTQYGSRTYLRQIGMMAMGRGDVFLVGHFLGVAGVGIYSVAVTLSEVMTRFPDAVGWVLMPRSAGAADSAAQLRSARYARLSMLFAALLAIPYLAAADLLVNVALPESFHGVVTVLALLMPGMVASCISRVLGADLVGRGHAAVVARTTWATAGVLLCADLVLIPAFGLAGAAAANSIAQIVAAAVMARIYGREAGLDARTLLMISAEDVNLTLGGLSVHRLLGSPATGRGGR